jgi:hypothetical protein
MAAESPAKFAAASEPCSLPSQPVEYGSTSSDVLNAPQHVEDTLKPSFVAKFLNDK